MIVPTLAWILLATFLGGLLSAALASLVLLLGRERRTHLLPHLISFATGAMLAAALLGLLPEAVAGVGPGRVEGIGAALLGGIALFFVLEKLVLVAHLNTIQGLAISRIALAAYRVGDARAGHEIALVAGIDKDSGLHRQLRFCREGE